MSVLKNACKNVFFLVLFLSTPLCVFSNNVPDSFSANKIIENALTNQNVAEDSELVDKSRTKLCKKHRKLTYYLYISDFISSFIEIPTSNVAVDSSTVSSRYLAGRAPLYDKNGVKVGICSASFLCMQDGTGIFTDISNYLSVDNGLIVTWFTPTTLINLELDSIVNSMVTECIVIASTKVGVNPFYGKTFNMVVSSDNEKIYFKLNRI